MRLVIALLTFNICASELVIHEKGFLATQKLGVLKVLRDQQGYAVLTNGGVRRVHNYDIDTTLKKMNNNQLVKFLNEGNGVIRVTKFNNGEFRLNAHVYGKGGGVAGCYIGAALGKIGVSIVGHGTIYLVSSLSGPAGPGVAIALESYFGSTIELVSIKVAVALGLTGAVLTGPV